MRQNRYITGLTKILEMYPREEKLLLVSGFHIGREILEHLAKVRGNWINLRPITVESLAFEVAEEYLVANNLLVLSFSETLAIVDKIFSEASAGNALSYFQRNPINKGMVESLTRSILDLRYSNIFSSSLCKKSFATPEKAEDIAMLLSKYEKVLEEESLLDAPGLIMRARAIFEESRKDNPRNFYLITGAEILREIEKTFITNFAGDRFIFIEKDPVFGLPNPKTALVSSSANTSQNLIPESDIERLQWIFQPEEAIAPFHDSSFSLFSSYGCENEVREVFRRIFSETLALDEVEIVCTDIKTYGDILYSLSNKRSIPMTFAFGIPLCFTNVGRALLFFLQWLESDFEEIYLRRLFEYGLIASSVWNRTDSPKFSFTLAFLLRTSGIGWGRDRYCTILGNHKESASLAAVQLQKEGNIRWKQKEKYAENYATLLHICRELLNIVPDISEEKISLSDLCGSIQTFLEKYVERFSSDDSAATEEINKRLETFSKLFTRPIKKEEALEKIKSILSETMVSASSPKPGHLHCSHYLFGGTSGRKRTFVIGLDDSKFPPRISQDPILLDEERIALSSSLSLSSMRVSEGLYQMASMIAGLRGKVTFSCSTYDTIQERTTFPSSLLLQVYRLATGDYTGSYEDLENFFADGSLSETSPIPLDQNDIWLTLLSAERRIKEGKENIIACYPNLAAGIKAQEARNSPALTCYDGVISLSAQESSHSFLDPNTLFSCSKLESIAKCPFNYFLEYLLHVRPPEERRKDPLIWLTPLHRGSLLHEVFRDYYSSPAIKECLEEEQLTRAMEVLDQAVNRYKEIIPSPSERVFSNEYRQLQQDMKVFLHIAEKLAGEPVFVERSFGESTTPFSLSLGGAKKIFLRGRIDRIDKCGSSRYAVWDYKTGSTYTFEEKGFINKGTQLQHAVYGAVAECLLREEDNDATVMQTGYLFPTEKGMRKGEGTIFAREVTEETVRIWQKAIEAILAIVDAGLFFPAPETGFCSICQYKEYCDGNDLLQWMKKKQEDNENTLLFKPWKTLQEIK